MFLQLEHGEPHLCPEYDWEWGARRQKLHGVLVGLNRDSDRCCERLEPLSLAAQVGHSGYDVLLCCFLQVFLLLVPKHRDVCRRSCDISRLPVPNDRGSLSGLLLGSLSVQVRTLVSKSP